MELHEIEVVLASLFRKRTSPEPAPTQNDWLALRGYCNCEFSEDMERFYRVVSIYWFEGELLRISGEKGMRDDDCIVTVYEQETHIGGWPKDLIPFYSIGNGDYECVSTTEGTHSAIY